MEKEQALELVDLHFSKVTNTIYKEAWQTLKAAVLSKQTNNNARDEICPYFKRDLYPSTGGISGWCLSNGKNSGQTSSVA